MAGDSSGFPLAVVANSLSDDPRQAAMLARRAGFAGLLYEAFDPRLSLPELSQSGRRDFLHALSAHDLRLVGLRADTGPKGLSTGADVDRVLARLDRAMEAAAGLRARLLCVDLGPLPQPPAEVTPMPRPAPEQAGAIILPEPAPRPQRTPAAPFDSAAADQVDAALKELGEHADRFGVLVAFRSELASFAAIQRALKAVDCPWFGVDLDPVAILRDEWSLDQVLSSLGSLVKHVRARDAVCTADRRTQPAILGQGSTDWACFLNALDEAGYAGWITVDPLELTDRAGAAGAALAHLQSMLGKPR